MNLKQIQYMLVLANAKSFSDTAESLGISQPSLSQYVKKLEQELGMALIDRSSGSFRLTDAGQVYLHFGRQMMALQEQMTSSLQDLSTFQTGSIRVGISPFRAVCLMPEIVAAFQREYPGMHIVLDERARAELLDGAAHGEFDLFVTTLPIDETRYDYTLMLHEEIVLVVPDTLKEAAVLAAKAVTEPGRSYPVADLRDLDRANFVFLGAHQPMQVRTDELCSRIGIMLRKAAECSSIEAQCALVQRGVGAALVPSSVIGMLKREHVAVYLLRQDVACRDIVVAHRKEQYLSRAVQRLEQIMLRADRT